MIWNDPFSYELNILTLVNNEGVAFDIRKIFLELKLHEAITQNFLSGEISIFFLALIPFFAKYEASISSCISFIS